MIIRRRLDRGLKTKIMLSDKTGLSTRVLGDIEAGKRRAGTVTYIQIEKALAWPTGTISDYLNGTGSILDDEIDDEFSATIEPPATATAETPAPDIDAMSDEEFDAHFAKVMAAAQRRMRQGPSRLDEVERQQENPS